MQTRIIYPLQTVKPHNSKGQIQLINETYHIENEFIFQLDPTQFDLIPEYVVKECDKILEEAAT